MNAKVSYTPYISSNDNFEIPESSFLHPIKLDPKIVEEVIPIEKTKEPIKTADKQSNLIWARKAVSQPLVDKKPEPVTKWEVSVAENTWNPETIDSDDIKLRQQYAESAGNTKAISKAGAKGLYQIMNAAHKDYISATGKNGDLFDPVYNESVRDWYMDNLSKSKTIAVDKSSKIVALAKQLAAYNWGIGNLGTYLEKMKNSGVDIYNSLDWIEGLPQETKDYVNFIALKKGVGSRSEEAYNRFKNKLG